jgi:hypothetical protein
MPDTVVLPIVRPVSSRAEPPRNRYEIELTANSCIVLCSSQNAVNISSACTTNRFPSSRCASAMKIVRPSETTAETQPQLQPALLRLSAMISQYFIAAHALRILPGPNPNAGFGEGGPLKQGESDTIKVTVRKSSLKVTLVWTDPPGAALQNDLDLIVGAPNGQERHGNKGTSNAFDRANNVEQVVWNNIPPGDIKIIFKAYKITNYAQPYAYAWRIHP